MNSTSQQYGHTYRHLPPRTNTTRDAITTNTTHCIATKPKRPILFRFTLDKLLRTRENIPRDVRKTARYYNFFFFLIFFLKTTGHTAHCTTFCNCKRPSPLGFRDENPPTHYRLRNILFSKQVSVFSVLQSGTCRLAGCLFCVRPRRLSRQLPARGMLYP